MKTFMINENYTVEREETVLWNLKIKLGKDYKLYHENIQRKNGFYDLRVGFIPVLYSHPSLYWVYGAIHSLTS